MDENKASFKVIIAATGSVAAIKIPLLVKSLINFNECTSNYNFEVALVVTEHAKHFFDLKEIPPGVPFWEDKLEWSSWSQRGDPIPHIELGKWADVMVIAPLDANTLAKMAQGICDNLLTCATRAWDMSKPLLFCPAMNTRMWNHPITAQQIEKLKEWGHIEIPPISKLLMCGDSGIGAMAEVQTIVAKIVNIADSKFSKE